MRLLNTFEACYWRLNLERVNHTFGPFFDSESRMLFLGSFPSVKSREALFYYGHPQNRFWNIMRRVFKDDFGDSVSEKAEFLHKHHIALYDVIDECDIQGSSDASIKNVVPTDLVKILSETKIERIFVNGKTAEKYYKKYQEDATGRTAICLPSSSPANAAWSLEKLCERWKKLIFPHIEYYVPLSERARRFYEGKNINDGYLVHLDLNSMSGMDAKCYGKDSYESFDKTVPENDFPIIRFHAFDDFKGKAAVNACFTTRVGGVSSGDLSTLNLGFTRGDKPEKIKENFIRSLCAFNLCHEKNPCGTENLLNVDKTECKENLDIGTALLQRTVMTQQVHSDKIIKASKSLALDEDCTVKAEGVDGLYTSEKNMILSATFADCVPVFLFDKEKGRIALVHSGWKGTAKEIAVKGVRLLERDGAEFEDLKGAKSENPEGSGDFLWSAKIIGAENIIAEIGPSISCDHYEVTGEVIEEIAKNYSLEEQQDIFEKTDKVHFHLDMWAAIYYSLIHAGVLPENIYFSGICTYENASILFSHRRSGGRRGNMNAFFELI